MLDFSYTERNYISNMGFWAKALFIAILSVICLKANASYNSYDAQQCSVAIKYYENKYDIPESLLHSIAIIESGRWDKSAKKFYPWPWAVGIEGKPYFFENKYKAVKFVKEQMRKGVRNIDVGCNQINLHHHGKNFSNIEQAFNPVINTNYAANFLKNHYTNTKNWGLAVARYHSHTPHLGEKYASKVITRWKLFLREALPVKTAGYKKEYDEDNKKPLLVSKVRSSSPSVTNKPTINRQKKLERSKEGIIVFSRNKLPINKDQIGNPAIVEISERILSQY